MGRSSVPRRNFSAGHSRIRRGAAAATSGVNIDMVEVEIRVGERKCTRRGGAPVDVGEQQGRGRSNPQPAVSAVRALTEAVPAHEEKASARWSW